MGRNLQFSCACGELHGVLRDVDARSGTHVTCHCDDCRANLTALGHTDPGAKGVDIFQTTPDRITIEAGGENLGILRLGPKGLLRWYAKCCSTPLFNTLPSGKIPFVGVQTTALKDTDALGPIQVRGFIPGKNGKQTHQGLPKMIIGMGSRALSARLSGKHRDTPFFDADTGAPTAPQRLLTREERAAALQGFSN